eukprot:TRINITY_DN13599_c0_g1_i1.p1 TRINITY_DN13599_c0_g1~~TRINITY_DN13599_c0_g1_i1.p1  ORF type:complete len:907 (+),score=114.26 TRINITY_DN13599_c0_g1_i1:160-2880(+)
MPSLFRESYRVRQFEKGSLSALVPIPTPSQNFIPQRHPDKPFFSKSPVAYVNVGFCDGYDAGVTSRVRLLTPGTVVKVANDLPYSNIINTELDDFVASYRWNAKKIAYEVNVPKSGLYDVTVVLAETDVKFHAASVHLLTVEVHAVETFVKMDLNVFEEVGSNTPYVLCFNAVEVHSDLTITVYSTHDDGYAKLNGFIVTEFHEKHTNTLKSSDLVAVVDCGNARFDWDGPPPNVTLQAYENSDLGVTSTNVGSANPLLAGLAMSTRLSAYPLGYDITVEQPGRYDVSLCFSELKLVTMGKRKFDVHVGALDVFQEKALDVYAEAGMYTPYVLTARDLRVDDKISVRFTDEVMGPIISGVIVSKACSSENGTAPSHYPALDDSYITTVNCGPGLTVPANDPGMKNNVRFNGNTSHRVLNSSIIGEDLLFMNMGKSCRWSNADFEYDIVPKNAKDVGRWDIAVVLCETDPTCFVVGKRLVTVEVVGAEFHRFEDIDVYKEVGAYRTKVIRVSGLNLGSRPDMTVRVIKSGTGPAMISGIVIAPTAMRHSLMQATFTPVAFVNCGVIGSFNNNFDGGAAENIQFTPVGVYGDAVIRMTGNMMLREMCSRMRTGYYKYIVDVEEPGKYDVFLFFAEIYYNGEDARVFDVEVSAKDIHEVKHLDVYAEVGKYRPFVLQFTDIDVQSTLQIEGKKVKALPMISGFLVMPAGAAKRIGKPCFVADELVDLRKPCNRKLPKALPPSHTVPLNASDMGEIDDEFTNPLTIDCGKETELKNVTISGVETSQTGSISKTKSAKLMESDTERKNMSHTYRSTVGGPFSYNIEAVPEGMYRLELVFCEYEKNNLRRFSITLEGKEELSFTVSFTEAEYMKVKVASAILEVDSSMSITVNEGENAGFLNGIRIEHIGRA